MVKKIISGGQTGVDRAVLDAAMELGISTGGWCCAGRSGMDGSIPEKYNTLQEAESSDYSVVTDWNIRDSDATLILNLGPLTRDSKLCYDFAEDYKKPYLVCRFDAAISLPKVDERLKKIAPKTLNIAGPREEERPGIYEMSHGFLIQLLQ